MHWLFCQKFILVATSLGSKMPKRKRGTKAEPLCPACGKHGHYASSCVLLAKAVLSQITKTTSVATLQKLLQNETPLNLQEGGKKQRCGKTKGRRGKRVTASQKKPKRTYVADRCVAERKRTPRPRRTIDGQPCKHEAYAVCTSSLANNWLGLEASLWLWKQGFSVLLENLLLERPWSDFFPMCILQEVVRLDGLVSSPQHSATSGSAVESASTVVSAWEPSHALTGGSSFGSLWCSWRQSRCCPPPPPPP